MCDKVASFQSIGICAGSPKFPTILRISAFPILEFKSPENKMEPFLLDLFNISCNWL